ncbi:YbhQ family protein, partial [Crocosphaera watsonii]|uniref:YbhQ family protein n=1 Tax=Crocosphaera watsonii TaxID=263511 RepID=UPI003990C156
MKWQQRVRVATGLSCWQIMLHLLVVALLVVGWMSKTLFTSAWDPPEWACRHQLCVLSVV